MQTPLPDSPTKPGVLAGNPGLETHAAYVQLPSLSKNEKLDNKDQAVINNEAPRNDRFKSVFLGGWKLVLEENIVANGKPSYGTGP